MLRLFKRKPKKFEVPKKAITMGYYEAVQKFYESAAIKTIELIREEMEKEHDSDL